jgi:hypothetical protein
MQATSKAQLQLQTAAMAPYLLLISLMTTLHTVHNQSMPDDMDNLTDPCGVHEKVICAPYIKPGWLRYVVLVMSSALALAGVVANMLLLYLFIWPKEKYTFVDTQTHTCKCHHRIHPLYVIQLAFADACICLCYILLFGVEAVALRHELHFLYDLYYSYAVCRV